MMKLTTLTVMKWSKKIQVSKEMISFLREEMDNSSVQTKILQIKSLPNQPIEVVQLLELENLVLEVVVDLILKT